MLTIAIAIVTIENLAAKHFINYTYSPSPNTNVAKKQKHLNVDIFPMKALKNFKF